MSAAPPARTRTDFARFAALADAARRSTQSVRPFGAGNPLDPARPPAHPLGSRGEALSVARREPRGGRVPSLSVDLSASEIRELNVVAFGFLRQRELARERLERLLRVAAFRARLDESALIASIGGAGASVSPWEGVIGAEGRLTGDGRLIEYGALSWAALPLPLRFTPADFGGHDGAVLVGRIDSIERRPDGTIYARGVLDLGSELGREAERLVGAGLLTGVSMDLDSTTEQPSTIDGKAAAVMSRGRVRAATLVSIPAFDVARISLSTRSLLAPLECGCTSTAHITEVSKERS